MSTITQMGTTTLTSPTTNAYTNPTVADTVARPYTFDNQDVDTGLTRNSWEDMLRVNTTTGDVFSASMTNINEVGPRGVSIPDSIVMKVTAGGENMKHTIPVLDPITGSPRAGTAEGLLGFERNIGRLRYMTAFYTEMKDGVVFPTFGVEFNQNNIFGLYKEATPQLEKYWKEVKGRAYRESVCEWFNVELTKTSPSTVGVPTTRPINPNVLIIGEKSGVLPVWSSTTQTFANNIGCKLDLATVNGSVASDGYISTVALDRMISDSDELLRLNVLDDGTFVYLMPTPQWYRFTGLTTGQGGDLWKSVSQYSNDEIRFPGEVGMWRNVRIIKEDRYPTCVVTADKSGATGTYSFAFKYQQPGGKDGDERNKGLYTWAGADGAAGTGNRIYQIGMFLGKGAIIERVVKDLYYKEQMQQYDQYKGIGTFMEWGANLAVTRTDTEASGVPTYVENRGSAIVFHAATRI